MTQYDVFPTYQKIIDGERILYVHVNNKIIETKWADGTVQIETKQSNDKWKNNTTEKIKMKIQNIFIGVLFLLLGYSGYQNIVFIDEQKKDSKNLIKRIIKAETNIDNMIDHINNDAVDMLEIEKGLLFQIENLNGIFTSILSGCALADSIGHSLK